MNSAPRERPSAPVLLGAPGSPEQYAEASTIGGIAAGAIGAIGLLIVLTVAVTGAHPDGFNAPVLVLLSSVALVVGALNFRRRIPGRLYPLGFVLAGIGITVSAHAVGSALSASVVLFYMWFGSTVTYLTRRTAVVMVAVPAVLYAALLAVDDGHPLPLASWLIIIGATVAFAVSANRLVLRSRALVESERVARSDAETARGRLEAANNEKTRFIARMSHELRTPLNAIIGFSEVLAQRVFGPLTPKQAEYVDDVVDSGRHLLSLVDDLLDMAKVEAGSLDLDVSRVDLGHLVATSAGLFKEQVGRHRLTLHVDVDSTLGLIEGDSRKIRQVVFNLLSNAVKFTPDGGRVTVACTKGPLGVRLTVEDTGAGVATKDQDAIFREFEQADDAAQAASGTGLGLPLARRFVELHGGTLVLEPGDVGARFVADLPREPVLVEDDEIATPSPRKAGMRILGEDDTPDRRRETGEQLVLLSGAIILVAAACAALIKWYPVDEYSDVNLGYFLGLIGFASVCHLALRRWPQVFGNPAALPWLGVMVAVLLPWASFLLGGGLGPLISVFYSWIVNASFLTMGWRVRLLLLSLLGIGHAFALAALSNPVAPLTQWVVTMGFAIATAMIFDRFVRRITVLSDADREARAEAERLADQAASASRHKTEFLTNMSHELRTPLNAIIGFSEVLEGRAFGPLNEKQAEYVDDVLTAGRHLLALINDILDLAKVEAGHMELRRAPLDVASVIADVTRAFEAEARARRVALAPSYTEAGVIDADEAKVRAGIASLVSNALKFAPADSDVAVKAAADNGHVVITVSDDGPGVAAADHDRIFEAFSHGADAATPDQGSGLGLALARRYAELHGGTLRVTSAPGAGATFILRLPT